MPSAVLWALIILLVMDAAAWIAVLIAERGRRYCAASWMLVILIFPYIGAFGYFLIGVKGPFRRMYRRRRTYDQDLCTDIKLPFSEYHYGGVSSKGDEISIFSDGKEKFASLMNDIENAERTIHIEYYYLEDDALGNKFSEILCRKAEEGLEVMILLDHFGCRKLSEDFISKLTESGVRVAMFHPVKGPTLDPRLNHREHRKIAIIDGSIAYTGGFNISDAYVGNGPLGYWRDTAMRTEGGLAQNMESYFRMVWNYVTGEDVPIPAEIHHDDPDIFCLYGGPDMNPGPAFDHYLRMIRSAEKTIDIMTPYLTSDAAVKEIISAADRGVNIRIILPDEPDHWFTYWNNLRSCRRLMRHGVSVGLYSNGFMHSKVMVADGRYCSIGSTNLDNRSGFYNFESNIIVCREDVCNQQTSIFENDLALCRELGPGSERGIAVSLKMLIALIFQCVS